ncbi:ROK family protein [Segeticoccus rhizosphaerae]|uniref:ROK family protein n=1 Tax=Segeticoccus rhizosphaerae TaxID=1104777 RepID=UPI001396AFA7|nr:ROK family protein [Segeticoccus rhizosphaerae]
MPTSTNGSPDAVAPAFAVDIGGSRIRVAAVSPDLTLQPIYATPDVSGGPAGLVKQLEGLVRMACEGSPLSAGVVATPGAVNSHTGTISSATNLPLTGYPLGDALSQRLGVDVKVVVDTAAAAVAEFGASGAAADCSIGAYVTVSTGIGTSLVVDGRVVEGAHSRAGELGHVPVRTGPEAEPCPCGQRGCLEMYASGAGLARLSGRAGGPTGAAAVLDAARHGEPGARQLVEQAVDLLCRALAGLVHVLDPAAVVLGGGLLLGGRLLEVLVQRLGEIIVIPGWSARSVLREAAHGDLSPLTGAAALAAGTPAAMRLIGWKVPT